MIAQIIGIGNVGSTIAFSLIGRCKEIIITDINQDLLYAQFLDLGDASYLINGAKISISKEIVHADIYIITAGLHCSNKDRSELLLQNKSILIPYFYSIAQQNREAWVLIATNPSHELAKEGLNYMQKVIPLGSMLDNARQKRTHLYGKHEEPKDMFKDISTVKGCTQFGVAAECLRILSDFPFNALKDKHDYKEH